MVRLGRVNKCKRAGSLHRWDGLLDYRGAARLRLASGLTSTRGVLSTLGAPMSIAVYVTGIFFVWLLMVVSLGLALRRCLAARAEAGR